MEMRRTTLTVLMIVLMGCGGKGPPSPADLNGPWVWYDDGGNPLAVVRFDGVDVCKPIGVFDATAGTYTVDDQGNVTVDFGITWSGVLNSARDEVDLGTDGTLVKVANSGGLAGNWTELTGAPFNSELGGVTFTVDSSGSITSISGSVIGTLDEGYAYTCDYEGTVIGLVYWSCPDLTEANDYNEVLVIGVVAGNVLMGQFLLDDATPTTPDGTAVFSK